MKSKFAICDKTDCFAYDNELLKRCTLIVGNSRDAPEKDCTFYKSDPNGRIKQKIKDDIRRYESANEGRLK